MITIQNIAKAYGGEQVLQGLSFQLAQRHTLSVLGKSGCGKSTLLKIMAGLETADAGIFEVDGDDMLALPPQKREVVYLSQEPLLFPHLTVAQNLGYGLEIRKAKRAVIRNKVGILASKLGLTEHLNKKPRQLSGGQKQRVNFGRALIINPRIMLLDEPFGSLDTQTRADMQTLFQTVKYDFRITALFVTHDLKEALLMGDCIGLMQSGKLRVFDNLQAFVDSPDTGVLEEWAFWEKITKASRSPGDIPG